MNKERPIDLQSIYDQVRSYYELDNDFDIESILDPIYTFLSQNTQLPNRELSQDNQGILFTYEDEPVIRTLLILMFPNQDGDELTDEELLDDDDDEMYMNGVMLRAWLNNELDLGDYNDASMLFTIIKLILCKLSLSDAIENSTYSEWIQAFSPYITSEPYKKDEIHTTESNLSIDRTEFIGVRRIYEEVMAFYNWNTDYSIDILSKESLLKKKYAFLFRKVLMRNRNTYKKKGNNMVPMIDAPIIRELLIKSVSPKDNDQIIVKWFNGKIDKDNSEAVIALFNSISTIISKLSYTNQIDQVTAEEWRAAIASSTNYDVACSTLNIKEQIEKIRSSSLALNNNIRMGDIIYSPGDGRRYFDHIAEQINFDVENVPLSELLKSASSQNDYLKIVSKVLELVDRAAMENAISQICFMASLKNLFGLQKADSGITDESLASEYIIWYQRIYEYLSGNPDVLSDIEAKTQTENLLDFFKMDDR